MRECRGQPVWGELDGNRGRRPNNRANVRTTSHALKKAHRATASSSRKSLPQPLAIVKLGLPEECAKYSATTVATTGEESNGVGEARPQGMRSGTAKYVGGHGKIRTRRASW